MALGLSRAVFRVATTAYRTRDEIEAVARLLDAKIHTRTNSREYKIGTT